MSESGERTVRLTLHLRGGHCHELRLPADSAELRQLFSGLAERRAGGPELWVQLPVDGGHAACTVSCSEIVSVFTEPPVLVDLTEPSVDQQRLPARWVQIEDLLAADEHEAMVRYAIEHHADFEPATVSGELTEHYRTNQVLYDFASSDLAAVLASRFREKLPQILQDLGLEPFPVTVLEQQLTASGDGTFFRLHADHASAPEDPAAGRKLTLVYYFHRPPKSFTGGELRLYDGLVRHGQPAAGDTFATIEPKDNSLVVFPSDTWHELLPVSCPSREFLDSRFAVTCWIHHRPGQPSEDGFDVELGPDSRPGRAEGVREGQVRDRVVLAIPGRPPLCLDPGGSELWRLCDGARTVEQIAGELAERHGADPRRITLRTQTALRRLVARGALVLAALVLAAEAS